MDVHVYRNINMGWSRDQRFEDEDLIMHPREELAKRQRDEPAFRWLVDFLKLGIAHQDSELILSGPEEKCFYLERERLEWIRRELSGKLVLLILISSWFRVVYGRK